MRKYLIILFGLLLIPACSLLPGLKPAETLPTELGDVGETSTELPERSPSPGPLPTETQVKISGKPAPPFADLHMFPGDSGWAVGAAPEAAGQIFHTSDGGYTWIYAGPPQEEAVPAGYRPYAFFLDPEQAWVTYYPAEAPPLGPSSVWHTADGGGSWTPGFTPPLNQDIPDYAFEAMYFTDAENGWLMLAHSPGAGNAPVSLFGSRDAGVNWEILLDPFDGQAGNLHTCCRAGMLFLDNLNGFVPYSGGPITEALVHVTRDGGRSWISQELPPADTQLFARAICGTRSISGLGEAGLALVVACFDPDRPAPIPIPYLYISKDAGFSWSSIALPDEPVQSAPLARYRRDFQIQFIDATNGWLFLLDEDWSQGEPPAATTSIYQTQDGGLNWVKKAQVNWIGDFSFSDPQNGWAITRLGKESGLLRTGDGGENWQPLNPVLQP